MLFNLPTPRTLWQALLTFVLTVNSAQSAQGAPADESPRIAALNERTEVHVPPVVTQLFPPLPVGQPNPPHGHDDDAAGTQQQEAPPPIARPARAPAGVAATGTGGTVPVVISTFVHVPTNSMELMAPPFGATGDQESTSTKPFRLVLGSKNDAQRAVHTLGRVLHRNSPAIALSLGKAVSLSMKNLPGACKLFDAINLTDFDLIVFRAGVIDAVQEWLEAFEHRNRPQACVTPGGEVVDTSLENVFQALFARAPGQEGDPVVELIGAGELSMHYDLSGTVENICALNATASAKLNRNHTEVLWKDVREFMAAHDLLLVRISRGRGGTLVRHMLTKATHRVREGVRFHNFVDPSGCRWSPNTTNTATAFMPELRKRKRLRAGATAAAGDSTDPNERAYV